MTRSDVNVYANYKDNIGTPWGMARVQDQMEAAEPGTPIRHNRICTFPTTPRWSA